MGGTAEEPSLLPSGEADDPPNGVFMARVSAQTYLFGRDSILHERYQLITADDEPCSDLPVTMDILL